MNSKSLGVEPAVSMRPIIWHAKLRRWAALLLVLLIFWHLHAALRSTRSSGGFGWPGFHPSPFHCSPIWVPPPLDRNGQVADKWSRLEFLFRQHPPRQKLTHKAFEKGETVQPTVAILNKFLNLQEPDAAAMRQIHADLVHALPAFPEREYKGRGIVMVAGGQYAEYASTSLGMLRLLGSRLPVEIWLKDAVEEEDGWCDELAREGIVCRYLTDYMGEMTDLNSAYQFKVLALLFSSFAEVLFLDADSIPVQNPDALFDAPAFRDTGAVLWPDYWGSTESPWLPYITGQLDAKSKKLPNHTTVDSGQMLWDKRRHWKTLCLSAYYNYHGPTYFYTLITQGGPGWGDKDTFPTALRALSLPYTLIPHRLETQYYNKGNDRRTGTGIAMLQADPRDLKTFRPMFLHSNLVKFSVRRLMCTDCVELPSQLTPDQRRKGQKIMFDGQVHRRKHPNWNALNHWKRIFATIGDKGLNHLGELDTEKDLWRVMERSACSGVWSSEELCTRTRRHLWLTFGITEGWRGQMAEICQELEVQP